MTRLIETDAMQVLAGRDSDAAPLSTTPRSAEGGRGVAQHSAELRRENIHKFLAILNRVGGIEVKVCCVSVLRVYFLVGDTGVIREREGCLLPRRLSLFWRKWRKILKVNTGWDGMAGREGSDAG